MDVYLVMYESFLNGNRIVGAGETLERARGIAAEWLMQRYGYPIHRWPEGSHEEHGYQFWYVDVHEHTMVITRISVDAPAIVESADDE